MYPTSEVRFADKMSAFEWNYESLTRLIDLYKEQPELWDPTNNNYHIKNKKNDAWILIANEMQCELAEVKTKMSSLLSSYRREKMKTKKSMAIAERPDEIYQSRWFAFKCFDFLKDRETPVNTQNNVTDEKASQDVSDDNNETPHSSRESGVKKEGDEPSRKVFCSSKKRFNKKNDPSPSHGLDGVSNVVHNECIKFGEFIAAKLQKFGEEERSILMHRINNFIYEAETELYSQQHYSYNSASSTPSSPSALQSSQVQSQPSAPQSPVPSSLLKQELMELSPNNCNSPL